MRNLLPIMLLAAACSGGHSGPDAGPPDANPFCVEAANHDDLPWLQANVFTPSCSRFTACHQGRADMAGGLSLEDGKTWMNLVNQDSVMYGPQGTVEHSTWKRVVPDDPDHSYLMVVLGQKPGPIDPMTGTMPYNSPLLCQEMRDAIERWIQHGALETPIDAGVDAMPIDAHP